MLEMIEDLGTEVYGTQGLRKRYWLVMCPDCSNPFKASMGNVKNGNTTRCKTCGKKASGNTTALAAAKKFEEEAKALHNNKYTYTDVMEHYTTCYSKILIECPLHGRFKQSATDHLEGKGCKQCGSTFYPFVPTSDAPGLLYYFQITVEDFTAWKIGITRGTLESRFTSKELSTLSSIHTWEFDNITTAFKIEQALLQEFTAYRYNGFPMLHTGNTELLSINILNNLINNKELINANKTTKTSS